MHKIYSNLFLIINLLSVFFVNTSCQAQSTTTTSQKRVINQQTTTYRSLMPSFADVVEESLPTVVNISTSQELSYGIEEDFNPNNLRSPNFDRGRDFDSRRKVSSIGSGFIISNDGYIVTNAHVIEDGVDINVSLNDGSKYKAKIVGVDKKTDLALLKINPNKDLKFAKFGDSNKARIGDWAIVIGNPYGLGGSVSIGIISARGRDINNGQSDEYIQTDAAINKGNSGGPLFNSKGEVIGISSSIFSPSGGSVGIGFATPSSNAVQVIRQLKDAGEVSRGWIGASVQDVTEELADSLRLDKVRGAFVNDVVIGGPADRAGIVATDVIIRFDEQEIEDMKSLPKIVALTPIGKAVKILVWRQGKVITLNMVIEKAPDLDKKTIKRETTSRSLQILGLNLTEINKNGTVEGLQVKEVSPKTEAFDKGIIPGDLILSVNQGSISSVDYFKEVVRDSFQKNKKIFLFLKRNGNSFAVVLNPSK